MGHLSQFDSVRKVRARGVPQLPGRKDWGLAVNFYKHYVGDFQRDTSHLSLTERGAYLALMHHYYATEEPLPNKHEACCRIAGAFSKAEKDAVKTAMAFFEPRMGGLWHKRIEAELEKSDKRSDKNREIALAREARKRAEKEAQDEQEESTKRARNVVETCHERSTKRAPPPEPEPEPEKKEKELPAVVPKTKSRLGCPVGVAEAVWGDFLEIRKANKAPLTATALAGIEKEAGKSQISLHEALEWCCTNGYRTFKAQWYVNSTAGGRSPQAARSVVDTAAKNAEAARLLGFTDDAENHGETIDV